MADTLAGMPIERAFVVHGEPGWDEASPAGDFVLFDVGSGSVRESTRSPEQYGMTRCDPAELAGGDAAHNAHELTRVLSGEDQGAHRDALLMGASLVLEVVGTATDEKHGVELAAAVIDSGAAQEFMRVFTDHFAT